MDKKEVVMAKKHSFIKLLTATGFALFLSNKYIDNKSNNKNKVHSTGEFFNYKYGEVYYNKFGSGDPILLIHDLNAMSSSYEWEEIIDDLSENHTVYTIDLLGCGQSAKPNIIYTNFLYVEMLKDFIKSVVKEKAIIITSHNSGSIGVMINHMHPELVKKVILINPNDLENNSFITTQKDKLLKKCIYLPLLGTSIYNSAYTEENIKKVLRETYFYNKELGNKYFDLYYQVAHYNESKSRYLYASIRCKYTNIDIANGINDKDNIIIIESSERYNAPRICEVYQKKNSEIKIETLDNSKLLPQLETPGALIELLNKEL